MRVVRFENPRAFQAQMEAFLTRAEAEHSLMLGLIGELARQPREPSPTMAAVVEGDRVIAVALCTPPFRLLVSHAANGAAELLARDMALRGALPGVNGPVAPSGAFAEAWAAATGDRIERGHGLRAHAADHVEAIAEARGHFREARPEDAATLIGFWRGFASDAKTQLRDAEPAVTSGIRERRLFVWEDGEVVSMAQAMGPTPNGIRVNLVYTPPELRGRGYATSCVAALTRRLLESGQRACFLYTDVTNPVSNRIYARIGYRPMGDLQEYSFHAT